MPKKSNRSKPVHWLRLAIRSFTYVLTGVTTLIYLASALSPYISPRLFSYSALLGLMFPICLLIQGCIWAYWLLRRRWYIVAGLSLVFALSWGSITSYLPLHRNLTKRLEDYHGRRLKILSYNVCGFGFMHHKAQHPNKVLLYLKGSEADVICLQEASLAMDKHWGVTMEQIKAYLGKQYPYIRTIAAQEGGSALMLLSRYPIKRVQRIELSSRTNGAAHFTLNIEGQETHVINLHLESFRLSPAQGREYMHLVSEGKAVELGDAMSSQLTPVFLLHADQAQTIYQYIQTLQTERLIVCGDFNDTPVSYAHHTIAQGMKDAFIVSGNGLGFSFVSRTFLVRIDHILLGKAFDPYYTRVDTGVKGSDHYPIYTYVRIQ